jgi:3-mercaptopropionate dioxygenase
MRNLARLRTFVGQLTTLVDATDDEPTLLERGSVLLADLVAGDDWLPEEYATPSAVRYQQYLLHCDPRERLSVVSFVWGPGQSTPIHDHRVWGLVGVLRGAELDERFRWDTHGRLQPDGPPARLERGQVAAVSPHIGDVHRVSNAHAHAVSISIHVYGGNIGAVSRATYEPDGRPKTFISGYANSALPNLWDRSNS